MQPIMNLSLPRHPEDKFLVSANFQTFLPLILLQQTVLKIAPCSVFVNCLISDLLTSAVNLLQRETDDQNQRVNLD